MSMAQNVSQSTHTPPDILHSSFFIELICLYSRSLANHVLSLKYVIYVFLSYILSVLSDEIIVFGRMQYTPTGALR
jgi:hypothetical protein